MASVEHLGDFVSMLVSAWEPSFSHILDSDHSIVWESDLVRLHREVASSGTR